MPASTELTSSRFEAGEIALDREDRLQQRSEEHHKPVALVRGLSPVIFYSLLVLLPLTAIPYGTVEPWWVALFECAVFLIAVLGVADALF